MTCHVAALYRAAMYRMGVLAVLMASCVACTEPAAEPTAASSNVTAGGAMQSSEVYQQIRAIVGEAKASQASFCRKVALGHRPCGGPESYLVYSAEGIDEPTLLSLVAKYGSLRKAEHEASGMMSTCEMIPEPGIEWVGGYCKAGGVAGDAI